MTDAEKFMTFLDTVFGKEETILKHECPHGGPPVGVFVYPDIPEKGMLTGVTFGLSYHNHPDWKFSRPELIISVESRDQAWAFAAAYFAAEFRGIKRFSYGDVFNLDTPIAGDSQMEGFLVFAQSILDPEVEAVQLNSYKVHFSQLYPIYNQELEIYGKIGLERFWKHEDFDMYNVKRSPIVS